MIERIQDLIENYSSNEYYKTYRKDETSYWGNILKMMEQDTEQVADVLDVGCAYGTLAAFAREHYKADVEAIDFKPIIDSKVITYFDIDFFIADIELTDIPVKRYDRIIFTEVLEHLYFNPIPTLRKLRDGLKPGGKLFLSTPDAKAWGRITKFYNSVDEMPNPQITKPDVDEHVYQYSREELIDILLEAGLIMTKDYSTPRHFQLELMNDDDEDNF